jgi:hypothetical protein
VAPLQWNPALDCAWLHVWLDGSPTASRVGEVWPFWTLPPYLTDYPDVIRRRTDDQPYTPQWQPPDRVVIYDGDDHRCIGLVELVSGPDWKEAEAVFWQKARVIVWAGDRGPRVTQFSERTPMQGGRYRLDEEEYETVHDLLGLPPWSRVGDEVSYRVLPDGEVMTKRLVEGDVRSDGTLRASSPLGRPLLGRSAGDVVHVALPRGPVKVEVCEVVRA